MTTRPDWISHVMGCQCSECLEAAESIGTQYGMPKSIDEESTMEFERGPVEEVNHPLHYGGRGNTYECIRVIEAWGLGFCLGNTVKYISRAGKKVGTDTITDLKKAAWYLNREIERLERERSDG